MRLGRRSINCRATQIGSTARGVWSGDMPRCSMPGKNISRAQEALMATKLKVRLNHDGLSRNLRFTAYHMLHTHLEFDRVVRDLFTPDPVKRLILLTVMAATIQRFVQDRSVPAPERAVRRMTRDEGMPMSRRAISHATGLPRETVRRHVEDMLRDGLLEARSTGVLANVLLLEQRSLTAIALLAEASAALTQKLVDLDVMSATET
jgi:hypothetical protein